MKKSIIIFNLLLLSVYAFTIIINIPFDYDTIQAGINAATEGDTVLVAAGTYDENITWPATNGIKLIGSGEEDCIIDGNQQASVIRFEEDLNGIIDTTTLIIGFTIQNGEAQGSSPDHYGGGMYCHSSSPNLINVTITYNSASFSGGIHCQDYSSPSLTDVTISNNSAIQGGGMGCIFSSPGLVGVAITGNSVSHNGGGMYCIYSSNPSLENVTISGNMASSLGGGMYCNSSSPSLVNCIFWYDSPQEIYLSSGSVNAFYSDIQGGWTGEGNIDSDPLFVDALNGDFHLTEFSPCIDAGDPNSPYDPDGTITDMGAYYYQQGINADFSANPIIGYSPLEVNFYDETPGNPTIWEWDFNYDGIIDSYVQNPVFIYNQSGIYSVDLTVSDEIYEDTMIKEEYISVIEPLVANFIGNPLSGNNPLEVNFTDISSGYPTSWLWDFDNDGFVDSNEQNPIHNYDEEGVYTVSLTVSNGTNTDTEIKVDYITVNSVSGDIGLLPINTKLYQNNPNPFNPTTTIEFSINNNSIVELSIYNIKGQKIKTLANNEFNKGNHSIVWNGEDEYGKAVNSGIYLYKLIVNSKTEAVKKCLLLK